MAKFLKHFGLSKKPPVPPTKDYENEAKGIAKHSRFYTDVENELTSKPALQQDYTNPLDFVNEVFCHPDEDSESVYMIPSEENVYSEPYESISAAEIPTNLIRRSIASGLPDDVYDEVSAYDDQLEQLDDQPHHETFPETDETAPVDYDEPTEWGAQEASLIPPSSPQAECGRTEGSPISTSSSQCTRYPTLNYDGSSSGNLLDSESSLSFEFCEENDMPIRHIYETAFDSKVKRETEDIDRLTQSPVFHGESSSSTSSPGSTGRETRVKVHNGVRSGKLSKNGHSRKERLNAAETAIPFSLAGPSSLPPDLPKPRLHPGHLQTKETKLHFGQLKTERRKQTVFPDRAPPPKPNTLPNQSLKIKAIIEPAPVANRSYSSSSSSSLDEQRHPGIESVKPIKFSLPKQLLNSKVQAAVADELTSVLKNKLKMGISNTEAISMLDPPPDNINPFVPLDNNNTTDNALALRLEKQKLAFDLNAFKASITMCTINGAYNKKHVSTPNGTTSNNSNEICPKCCQPIVVNETPQKKTSRSKSMEAVTSFSIKEIKPSNGILLCKCGLGPLQSPENDSRPLTDYDMPWDIPKRFSGAKTNGTVLPVTLEKPSSVEVPNETTEEIEKDNDVSEAPTNEKEDDQVQDLPPVFGESLQGKLFSDLERNSAPAALNKLGADSKANETLLFIAKSPSETQLAPIETIVQSTKPKLNGLGMRKNLNLNFNSTNSPPNKNLRHNLALNFGCAALTVKGEEVDPKVPLEEQGWYHGSISRVDAENSLRVLKEGSYLVRNSESSKQDYSLSLKSARGFMHMKIVNKDGHYILGQYSKPFSSIPEMIHHYSDNKLPIRGAEHMSLLYPVIGQLL